MVAIATEVIDLRLLAYLRSFDARGMLRDTEKVQFGGNEMLSEVNWNGRASSPAFHLNAPHLDSMKIECSNATIED